MPALLALHPGLTAAVISISLLMLVGSLALAPRILVRLPRDYFTASSHIPLEGFQHRPALRLLLLTLKNLIGVLLLLAGISMLVLPGQGLLTLFLALLILDFPGKYRLKKWMFQKPHVRKWINQYRIRHDCEPFE